MKSLIRQLEDAPFRWIAFLNGTERIDETAKCQRDEQFLVLHGGSRPRSLPA